MTKTIGFDAATAASLPGAPWLQEFRSAAAAQLASIQLPTEQEELWRYSRIDSFDLDSYLPFGGNDIAVPGTDTAPGGGPIAAEAGERSGLAVVHDGRVVHVELDAELAARGVVLGEAATVSEGPLTTSFGRLTAQSPDAFTILHNAVVPGGAVVHVPAGVAVPKPIVIVHWCEGVGRASAPHTLVLAEPSSEVVVIERMSSPAGAHFVNAAAEFIVQQNASVKYLSVQEHGRDTWQVSHQRAEVDRDSQFHAAAVALGGTYARLRCEASLIGERADARQTAVYYGDRDQMLDFRTLQDHRAPRTTSNLQFNGAVENQAASVYSGMIRLHPEAQRSIAHQTNRNLLLTTQARAESIPNLEIEANDVQCSHASTIGPIDEDQLYYLATRGVSPRDAARLIVMGFFNGIFAALPVPSMVDRLRSVVSEKVGRIDT